MASEMTVVWVAMNFGDGHILSGVRDSGVVRLTDGA